MQKLSQLGVWISQNQTVSIAVAGFITVAIVAAMYFGLDLSWIPSLVNRLIGNG